MPGPSRVDLIGKRFGNVVVLRWAEDRRSPGGHINVYYLCRCDCGNEKVMYSQNLRQGHTKSCGCGRAKKLSTRMRKRPYEFAYNILLKRSRTAEIFCDITYEQFLNFTKHETCFYCNEVIGWKKHGYDASEKTRGQAYHLDRKNNDVGYTMENCVVACSRCNWSKSNLFTFEEWCRVGKVLKEMKEENKENC